MKKGIIFVIVAMLLTMVGCGKEEEETRNNCWVVTYCEDCGRTVLVDVPYGRTVEDYPKAYGTAPPACPHR